MKRTMFISILAAFVFSLLLAFSIQAFRATQWQLEIAFGNNFDEYYREAMHEAGFTSLRNGLLFLAGSLCMIALYALFAVKEFKVFQPYVERFNAKRAARKQDKESATKQKRFEKIQTERDKLNAEFDELNADDKNNLNSNQT